MGFMKISPELSKELGFYIDTGLRFGLSIVLCFLGGLWLDRKTGLTPLFMLCGIMFGAVAGFYNLYRSMMGHQKGTKKE